MLFVASFVENGFFDLPNQKLSQNENFVFKTCSVVLDLGKKIPLLPRVNTIQKCQAYVAEQKGSSK